MTIFMQCGGTFSLPAKGTLATILCFLALATQTYGEPIAYTFTGTGSGTVGAQPFADAPFTIQIFGDTAAIALVPDPVNTIFVLKSTASTISLTGVGAGAFTEGTQIFVNQGSNAVGFTRSNPLADLLDIHNPGFAGYDLRTPLASVFDPAPEAVCQFQNVSSSLGFLSFTSARDITFDAQVVPEPSCTLLLGAGAFGALIFGHRTRKGKFQPCANERDRGDGGSPVLLTSLARWPAAPHHEC